MTLKEDNPRQTAQMTGRKTDLFPIDDKICQQIKPWLDQQNQAFWISDQPYPCATDYTYCGEYDPESGKPCRFGMDNCPITGRSPVHLFACDQWVAWIPIPQGIKTKKIPIIPKTGMYASPTDPSTWGSIYEAMDRFSLNRLIGGVGFVLTKECNIVFIDIDGCRDPISGVITEEAQRVVKTLNSLTEISQSGTGLHIFVIATLPDKHKVKRYPFEIYSRDHFVAMTGNWLLGTPWAIFPRQEEIEELYAEWFPESLASSRSHLSQRIRQSDEFFSHIDQDDEEVLERILSRKKSGNIIRLSKGDIQGYSSQSSADLALCNYYAQYTKDPKQIDRLFRRTQLYRQKWDEKHGHETYGEMTIRKALEGVNNLPRGGVR